MTFFEWVEDRLGHFVLQAVFVIVSTTVLLSTGTSIGIITLLLIIWMRSICLQNVFRNRKAFMSGSYLICHAGLEWQ